jgi:dTDP-4-amino-4,6-dideoxygalactose transaminase
MGNLNNWPSFSRKEILAVEKVLQNNKVNYWTGDQGRLFEQEFSQWCGAKFSIALANGTLALDLALKSINLKPGDEVIVTPRSFIASVSSVISIGAKPIFADVDINSGNLSVETIKKKITKKTRAVLCVHLAGLPCDMDPIMALAKEKDLYVIEDCAQAHGAKYKKKSVGTIGHIGTWSFCQDKIITTGGEGGMVTTNSKKLWDKMWSYKDHGKNHKSIQKNQKRPGFKWVHDTFGSNFRMTEMQAAIGRIQLSKMDSWTKLRNRNANDINLVFERFPNLIRKVDVPKHSNHAYYRLYAYVKETGLKKNWTRDRIISAITKRGVPCFIGSCPEIYNEKAFFGKDYKPNNRLANAKTLGETSIAFLCHPTITKRDIREMARVIEAVLEEASL